MVCGGLISQYGFGAGAVIATNWLLDLAIGLMIGVLALTVARPRPTLGDVGVTSVLGSS